MKGPPYFLLTAFGAVFFGVAAFFISKLPANIIVPANGAIIQNIFSSICASFVFLLTLDTGYYVREAFSRRSFRLFFGDLSTSTKSYMVYPDFIFSEESAQRLQGLPSSVIFRKRTDISKKPRFMEFHHIAASVDLMAIVIMATRMGRYLRSAPSLITDAQATENSRRSFISFGLTSNLVTELYLHSDPSPLFRIEDFGSDPKIVIQIDRDLRRYGRTEEDQHAVILRYRPSPKDYPTRVWIICAGVAAAGTPAAAWNLAHRWKDYQRRFGDDDFLVVLNTGSDVNAYFRSTEVCAISREDGGRMRWR